MRWRELPLSLSRAMENMEVGVGKQLSEKEKKLLASGHAYTEIDARYSSFKVTPKVPATASA